MPQKTQIVVGKGRSKRRDPKSLRNVVWIASYPKSGNTWVRIFLANYLLNARDPLWINHVHRIGTGDAVSGRYRAIAGGHYDPSDLVGHLKMRKAVLLAIAGNGADLNFVKTHNARYQPFGVELIPARFTRSAVYIIRNPLDLAVSYGRHFGLQPGTAVRTISREDNGIAADESTVQQYLLSWSQHVTSWTDQVAFPVHVMRYEDMKADPHAAFAALLGFLRIPIDAERLGRAVRHASFEEMKRQEAERPFIERSANVERFFHTGEIGQWQSALSTEDVEFLRQRHGKVMSRFGYL